MWRWVLESEGKFTAKSTYEFVSALNGPRTILHQVELLALKSVWGSPAPSCESQKKGNQFRRE